MKINSYYSLDEYYKIAWQKAIEMAVYYGMCIDVKRDWNTRKIIFTIDDIKNQEFESLQEVKAVLKNKNFM